MESLNITIEGKNVLVDTCEGDTQVMIDFCLSDELAVFMANDRQGANPWESMVEWEKPVSALIAIGNAAIELGRFHSENGKRVFFQGCDSKRQRVYKAMLRKRGIKCELSIDEDGDKALEVFF